MSTDPASAEVEFAVRPESFDVNDPALADDPWAAFSQLRESCPVFHSDQVGWVLTRADDVRAAARDHASFRSDWGPKGITVNNVPRTRETDEGGSFSYGAFPVLPIETDPPVHGQYRALLQAFFTGPSIEKSYGDEIRGIAHDLVAAFVTRGKGNFAAAVAEPMSGLAVAAVLGIPPQRREEFQERSLKYTGRDIAPVLDFIYELIESAERGAFYRLRTGEIDGRPLTKEEKLGYGMILVHAGWETTAGVLSTMAYRLATQPDLRQQLIDHPDLLETAVEEFIRIDGSATATWRTAGKDVTVRGCPIERGAKVVMLWGAASRDPEAFESPDEVHLDRWPNRHFSFGDGVHRCLGAGLARAEIHAVLAELTKAPAMSVDPSEPIQRHAGPVARIRSLPLVVQGPDRHAAPVAATVLLSPGDRGGADPARSDPGRRRTPVHPAQAGQGTGDVPASRPRTGAEAHPRGAAVPGAADADRDGGRRLLR